jgi:hypothetical protein
VAAGLALKLGCDPAQVPVAAIQAELVARGGKLIYFADVEAAHPHFAAIQWAALRSLVPADPDWRFGPDHPIDWGELVKAIVIGLELPISVTGAHFEGISRHHECYRYVESIYDLGTRAGHDLFGTDALRDEDPMKEFLRLYPGFKLLPFNPREPVRVLDALRFLTKMATAISMPHTPAIDWPATLIGDKDGLLTRGAMCTALLGIWQSLRGHAAEVADPALQ